MARIVIVDDEADCLSILELCLKLNGHEVYPLQDPTIILDVVSSQKPDIVITDIMMPGITGGNVYKALRAHFGSTLPIIICSGTSMKINAPEDPYLVHCPKPYNQDELIKVVNRFCPRPQSKS